MALNVRLMDLDGTGMGRVVLRARISQVMASSDGVRDFQAAYLAGRTRRVIRLHCPTSLGMPLHNGDTVTLRGVIDASPTGGLSVTFDPNDLRVEHTHDDRS